MIFAKMCGFKRRSNTALKACTLLLLLVAISGCGNKGDLYHPQEQTTSQTESISQSKFYAETDVSL